MAEPDAAPSPPVYHVVVYREGCGELINAHVDVHDHPDPAMIRIVVDCYKPGE